MFKLKGDYNRHMNRKIACKSNNELRENENSSESKRIQVNPKESKKKENKVKYKCIYCNVSFSTNSNMNKHIKICKVKREQENQKEELLQKLIDEMNKKNDQLVEQMDKQNKEMAEMKKEISKLLTVNKKCVQKIGTQQNTTIENQQNNQNIQNIQINNNNIKLLAFGSEDMSYVVDEVYKKILNKGFKSVPTFVQYLHFNKDKPQNHNVYISNMQTNYAIVYDGEDWKLKERDSVLQQLVDDKTGILSVKFDELLDGLDEPTVRKFRRFIDESDENEVVSQMKNDLKLVLYNNRKIAERTKQQLYPQVEPKMIESK
jgi:hypothetical protein